MYILKTYLKNVFKKCILSDFRFEMDSQVYAISKETMEGSGEGLMDHIAECLAIFAKGRKISKTIFLAFNLPKNQRKFLPNFAIAY